MVDREKALNILLGRYRYDHAMRLFGEYCLLLDEAWSDFVGRHTPLRLKQIHKQLSAVGLWPPELVLPASVGTGNLAGDLIMHASKAVTGMLGNLRAKTQELPPLSDTVTVDVSPKGLAVEPSVQRVVGGDPEALLQSLVVPTFSLELAGNLHGHAHLAARESPLADAVGVARYRVAHECGFVFPLLDVRQNPELAQDTYVIRIFGETVGEGSIHTDLHCLLNVVRGEGEPYRVHPVRGGQVRWVPVHVAASWSGEVHPAWRVVAEHIEHVAKRHAHRMLTNQAVELLLRAHESEIGKETFSELFGRFLSLTEIRLVLQRMLQSGHSIRPIARIVDILLAHFIEFLSGRQVNMDDTWKISAHVPFCSTDTLYRVVCDGLGLPAVSEQLSDVAASLERVMRQPSAKRARVVGDGNGLPLTPDSVERREHRFLDAEEGG